MGKDVEEVGDRLLDFCDEVDVRRLISSQSELEVPLSPWKLKS